jgi:hypothetical protein
MRDPDTPVVSVTAIKARWVNIRRDVINIDKIVLIRWSESTLDIRTVDGCENRYTFEEEEWLHKALDAIIGNDEEVEVGADVR